MHVRSLSMGRAHFIKSTQAKDDLIAFKRQARNTTTVYFENFVQLTPSILN